VAHQQSSNYVKLIALEFGLMPMNDKYLLPGPGMPQDQCLFGSDAILLHPMAPHTLDVVVAQDEVQPFPSVKPVEQIKDAPMSPSHVAELPVLP
jgi:hypothetical protein